jgi:hypothetical protein
MANNNFHSLESFRSQIKDIARPYHFHTTFNGGCFGGLDQEQVTASIRTSSIPGLTINPVTVSYFGMNYHLAGTPTYEPLSCQFIIDGEYEVLKSWAEALDNVFTYDGGPQFFAPSAYMGEVSINQFGPTNVAPGAYVSSYTLFLAFLSGVSVVSYGHETKDTPLVFDATIQYSYYKKTK